MPRFAIIDHHSGYVWGVTDASSPEDACRRIDLAVDPSAARQSAAHGPNSRVLHSGASGYHVYAVPAGFDVADGQNADEIAATEAHECVATVVIQTDEMRP